MRPILWTCVLLSLSGCAFGSLEQLRLLAPEANDFSSALSAEYLAFADSESEQGHALSAEYFAGKGMKAWHGENVPLETAKKPELDATRRLLTALLVNDVKAVVPQPAAHAQLLFDCWVKQAGKKDGGLCAEELQSELAILEDVAVSLGMVREETKPIVFAPGSSQLSTAGERRVRAIVASLRGDAPYIIELDGNADNAKRARLFKSRVTEIRKAFRLRGISDAPIHLRDSVSEKTVYLSNDSTMKEKDVVDVTIRKFNLPPQERP
jgi:OmpA-OmpF porin, OOP family